MMHVEYRGPSTDPCGTSLFIAILSDLQSLSCNTAIYLTSNLGTTEGVRLTESKALEGSNIYTSCCLLLFKRILNAFFNM